MMTKILIDEATVKLALGKIKAARDCHPNAVDTLLFEAEEILEEALASEAKEQPAQQEFVSPGGGYVPAIPAQQALDKMAENAKELGLDYEPAQQEPVGAIILGKVIDTSDGPEYEEWEVEWNHKAIDTLQYRLVTGDPVTLNIYTTPQPAQHKPLTADQIRGIYEDCDAPTFGLFTIAFARAIEAAHGIKENT